MTVHDHWALATPTNPSVPPSPKDMSVRQGRPGQHVVVVDDNDADLFFISVFLKRYGFIHVHQYSSGEDAISAYRQGIGCDLILMDVRMPQMDGFATLDGMTEVPRWELEHPKVYMMSAASNANDLDRVSESAFIEGFVRKPLSAANLDWLSDD